jgi:putative chitinase
VKAQDLASIGPVQQSTAARFVGPLNDAMARFGITTPERQAAFIAQVLHESRNLTRMVESLNYSPNGLLATFGRHLTPEQAERMGRTDSHPADQQAIANAVYANRNGNGAAASGDGWRFRGRGPVQITGRRNYAACGAALGLDLLAQPELLEQHGPGCLAAGWFWTAGAGRDLNLLADTGDIAAISRAINGGDNGLIERMNLSQRALKVLA